MLNGRFIRSGLELANPAGAKTARIAEEGQRFDPALRRTLGIAAENLLRDAATMSAQAAPPLNKRTIQAHRAGIGTACLSRE